MDEKQLQALFDAMQSKLELGDFATFKNQINSDDKFRKAFYTEASTDLDLGDFNAFEETFKKKVSTTTPANAAPVSGPVSVPTSPSVSQLPSESLKSLKGSDKFTAKATELGLPPEALSTASNDFDADDEFIIKKAKELGRNAETLGQQRDEDFCFFVAETGQGAQPRIQLFRVARVAPDVGAVVAPIRGDDRAH